MAHDKPKQRIRPEDLDVGIEAAYRDEAQERQQPAQQDAAALTELPRVPLRDTKKAAVAAVRPFQFKGTWPLPRYQPVGEVERSPLRIVVQARDEVLRRDVHLKLLGDASLQDRAHVQRFLQAAQIQSRLRHAGVPEVFDVGLAEDGRPYVVQKPVAGKPLAALLQGRSSPKSGQAQFLQAFAEVCDTVAHAHTRGVVHRFLTPADVRVDGDRHAVVLHWGQCAVLAEEGEAGADTSQSKTDERSDVFALGLMLAEIVTGHAPVRDEGTSAAAMLARVVKQLEACKADTGLVFLAKRCIARDRAARPKNAGEVARAVHSHLREVCSRTAVRTSAASVQGNHKPKSPPKPKPKPVDDPISIIPTAEQVAAAVAEAPPPTPSAEQAKPSKPVPPKPAPKPAPKPDAGLERALEREKQRANAEALGRRRMQRLAYAGVAMVVALAAVIIVRGGEETAASFDATPIHASLARMQALREQAETRHDPILWREAMAAGRKAVDLASKPGADPDLKAQAKQLYTAFAPMANRAIKAQNLFKQAKRHAALGENEKAVAAWGRVLELVPERTDVHSELAKVLAHDGKHKEAVAALREAIKVKPSPELEAQLITELMHLGIEGMREALGLAEGAVAKYPKYAAAHHILGEVHAARGDRRKAIKAWRKARDIDPGYPPIVNRFTKLYARAAVENNRDVLEGDLMPPGASERLDLADSCVLARRFSDAARIYDIAFLTDAAVAQHRGTLDQPRWRAARAAALAACLQGAAAGTLEASKQSELRRQVGAWLRADLAQWRMEFKADPKQAPSVARALIGWMVDPVLRVLQDPKQIVRMPRRDKRELRLLWEEVSRLLDEVVTALASDWGAWERKVTNPLVLLHVAYTLRDRGAYHEALDAYKRSDRVGRARFAWELPAVDFTRGVGAKIEQERRLPDVLAGKPVLKGKETLLTFAAICVNKRRYRDGLDLVERALEEDEDALKTDEPDSTRVYVAAACAIGAAASGDPGEGRDPKELRTRARHWLLPELRERIGWMVYDQNIERRRTSQQTLRTWQRDPHLAPVRDAELLNKLKPDEVDHWRAFWIQVDDMLTNAP